MAINPDLINIKKLNELPALQLAISNFIAHCGANGNLGKATLNDLATFIAPYVATIGASGYVPTTGTTLSNPTSMTSAFTIVGEGTFTQTTGGNVTTTDPLNVLGWNGTTWSISVEIPIDLSDYIKYEDINGILINAGIPTFNFGEESVAEGVEVGGYTYIFDKQLRESNLINVKIWVANAGQLKIKRFSKSNDSLSFIFKDEIHLNVVSGYNNLDCSFIFDKDDYISIYSQTANINYVEENSFSPYYLKLEDIEDDILISDLDTSSPTINIQVLFTFFDKKIIQETIEESKRTSFFVENALTDYSFGEMNIVEGVAASAGYTYIFDHKIPNGSILNSIDLFSTNAGTILIKKIKKTGNTYTFVEEVSITTSIGLNKYDIYPNIKLLEDDKLAIYTSTGGVIRMINYEGVHNTFVYVAGNLITSTSSVSNSDTQELQIKFNLQTLSDINEEIDITGNTVISYDFFDENLPDNIVKLGGTWIKTYGKAQTSSNGIENALQGVIATNFNSKVIRSVFSLDSSNARFGMYSRPTTFLQSGTIVDVNIDTNKISIYDNWDGSNILPSVFADKVISFPLIQGRKYMIEIISYYKDTIFKITDYVSGNSDQIVHNGGDEISVDGVGYAYGIPGVFCVSGTISVNMIQYVIAGTSNPKVILYGDSITEGYEINIEDCYSYKIVESLNNEAYTSAQSSCLPINVIRRIRQEMRVFRPKYIYVLIGTNSTNMTDWSNEIDEIGKLIESYGCIPIFGCIPPNAQDISQASTWNDLLLAKGYRCVRYDLAMTINNDRTTINPSMFLPDLRHPNGVGGDAMLNRFKIDVPELFD